MTSHSPKIDQPDSPAVGSELDTQEEQRIRELIQLGLASGVPIPVDDAFFQRLRARIDSKD